MAREADVRRSYKELFQAFDHLDVLVNNAGVGVIKPLVEMDLASFERVFATNVTGAMLMAREAAKHFMERNSGHIVNIGSTAAVRGAAKGTAYYGSKFALRGMTECWRGRAATVQRPGDARESQRGAHRLLRHGRAPAEQGEPDEAAGRRHRARRSVGA